jgi:hypothetical protein
MPSFQWPMPGGGACTTTCSDSKICSRPKAERRLASAGWIARPHSSTPSAGRRSKTAPGVAATESNRVRSAVDLLELPYSFTQRQLLTVRDFERAGSERGVGLTGDDLEALHRSRLLVPLFRVRRDGRAINAAARGGNPHLARVLAHWTPQRRDDLRETKKAGQLYDAAAEPFIARSRLLRPLDERTYEASVFLYAAQQLVTLPLIRNALPALRSAKGSGRVAVLDAPRETRESWREQAQELRDAAIVACALEPVYYSRLVETLTLPALEEFSAFDAWRESFLPTRMLDWLGVSAQWIRDRANGLRVTADRLDPLGRWTELVARANAKTWDWLQGVARNVMDLRIAAETLLLFHDDLVEAGAAEPVPAPHPRARVGSYRRLQPQRPLDALLTDFGLSPHPRLVVVVEGATERHLFPRVMRQLGVSVDDAFIAIEDAEGVDRDISPLIAYLAPRLDQPPAEDYAEFQRPPTRFLVVSDAEGKSATRKQRHERRRDWVERIMRTLPRDLRTPVVRDQLRLLVQVITWKRSGESFEFAHFTDRELALAIERLDQRRPRKPTLSSLIAAMAGIRRARGSLTPELEAARISKVDLADELWPTLERKIERALQRETERNIPIVRVVGRAVGLATEFPSGSLLLALSRR